MPASAGCRSRSASVPPISAAVRKPFCPAVTFQIAAGNPSGNRTPARKPENGGEGSGVSRERRHEPNNRREEIGQHRQSGGPDKQEVGG